eukprot:TRINITY_DN8250_c0_g1_i1.p2 TRINITY_DN8250_c0_g1~~TRINITY_DN8250_c0_g1_i1.p2  ORF type:complete len:121 (-),score=30.47 TRINITY_DN8250_c0_g1_i1:71-433(-)
MLDWFQVLAADVVQVDLLVFCLVQLADKRNVVATNDEHSMLQHFNARVWGVHPLLALLQNNVDHLVEPSEGPNQMSAVTCDDRHLSLIHISEPTRLLSISYAVFCLKKKKKRRSKTNLAS